MSRDPNKNVFVGLCMLSAGLAYFYMTTALPRRGAVDAAFFPYALSIGMMLLGALHLALNWRPKVPVLSEPVDDLVESIAAAGDDEDAPAAICAQPDYKSVGISLLLIALFIALMRPLGFALSAALYLFLQFSTLSPSSRRRPHLMHAVLAIGISVIIFALFRYGFGLMLPAGPLNHFIP